MRRRNPDAGGCRRRIPVRPPGGRLHRRRRHPRVASGPAMYRAAAWPDPEAGHRVSVDGARQHPGTAARIRRSMPTLRRPPVLCRLFFLVPEGWRVHPTNPVRRQPAAPTTRAVPLCANGDAFPSGDSPTSVMLLAHHRSPGRFNAGRASALAPHQHAIHRATPLPVGHGAFDRLFRRQRWGRRIRHHQ